MWRSRGVFHGSPVVVIETCTAEDHGRHASALAMLHWLEARMQEIPAECRGQAGIETATDYEEPCLTLSYTRPPTPEELQASQAVYSAGRAAQRACELKQLAELQAKYGNSPIVDM